MTIGKLEATSPILTCPFFRTFKLYIFMTFSNFFRAIPPDLEGFEEKYILNISILKVQEQAENINKKSPKIKISRLKRAILKRF